MILLKDLKQTLKIHYKYMDIINIVKKLKLLKLMIVLLMKKLILTNI